MDLSNKIQRIDIESSEYPVRLREIERPPGVLYFAGDISILNEESVSVVGSRRFTIYGRNVARMLGKRLGECGIHVVSGLAKGIDRYSHEGVLEGGGKMIGVLGSGILEMTPKSNYELMIEGLERGGVVVSEYEPHFLARRGTFPARNRIISALGCCTVVIEANHNSGALITAQHAMEQGRPVYAVPGNINSQFSLGSNLLIRDGAIPLVVINDLIRDLGIDPAAEETKTASLGEDEKLVYNALLRNNGSTADFIAGMIGRNAGMVNAVTTILEIKGIAECYGGKIYLAN